MAVSNCVPGILQTCIEFACLLHKTVPTKERVIPIITIHYYEIINGRGIKNQSNWY